MSCVVIITVKIKMLCEISTKNSMTIAILAGFSVTHYYRQLILALRQFEQLILLISLIVCVCLFKNFNGFTSYLCSLVIRVHF